MYSGLVRGNCCSLSLISDVSADAPGTTVAIQLVADGAKVSAAISKGGELPRHVLVVIYDTASAQWTAIAPDYPNSELVRNEEKKICFFRGGVYGVTYLSLSSEALEDAVAPAAPVEVLPVEVPAVETSAVEVPVPEPEKNKELPPPPPVPPPPLRRDEEPKPVFHPEPEKKEEVPPPPPAPPPPPKHDGVPPKPLKPLLPSAIVLQGQSGKLELGISVRVGKALLASVSADARFAAEPQFELARKNSEWFLLPVASAPNPTLFNGVLLQSEVPLKNGDSICLGSRNNPEKRALQLTVNL
jgi:hypothetical protein